MATTQTDETQKVLKQVLEQVLDTTFATVKGPKTLNEDECTTFTLSKNTTIMIVADGHGGKNGKIAAQVAVKFFCNALEKIDEMSISELRALLTKTFPEAHEAIRVALIKNGHNRYSDVQGTVRELNESAVHGGTTFTVCITKYDLETKKTHVITAYVGDSEAYLVKKDKTFVELTNVDHSPKSLSEWVRLKELERLRHEAKDTRPVATCVYDTHHRNKQVFILDGATQTWIMDPKYVSDPWSHGLQPANVRYEPGAYLYYNSIRGLDVTTTLAMTRSLGDFYAHVVGVTYEPSVSEVEVEDGDTIVVASDGLWDVWAYTDFASFVSKKKEENPVKLVQAEQIMTETEKRARAAFGSQHDDISVVVHNVQVKAYVEAKAEEP